MKDDQLSSKDDKRHCIANQLRDLLSRLIDDTIIYMVMKKLFDIRIIILLNTIVLVFILIVLVMRYSFF